MFFSNSFFTTVAVPIFNSGKTQIIGTTFPKASKATERLSLSQSVSVKVDFGLSCREIILVVRRETKWTAVRLDSTPHQRSPPIAFRWGKSDIEIFILTSCELLCHFLPAADCDVKRG